MGLPGCRFGLLERLPLGREEGFLVREAGLFFLGVTGFFGLIIFTVGWGDAAVVNSFLAAVEGTCVVWKPVFEGFEWLLYVGVVRGTLYVQWLYGLVCGLDKW